MSRPVVGLTLNYRDAVRTSRCIESLLADGASGVLVWDNSGDMGQSAAQLKRQWHSVLQVVIAESPNNLGFAAGVNRGLESVRALWPGAWVMLINNDAIVRRGALSALATALSDAPRAVIAFPQVDHGGRVIGIVHYQRHLAWATFDTPLPWSFPYASGSAMLIAMERTDRPLFDEDFFMYGEDVFLGSQLGPERMTHVAEVFVFHEGSASSRNGSDFYETRVVAGHWLLARKLARSRSERVALIAGRVVGLGGRALVRAIRSRSMLPFRALVAGWHAAFARRT